MEVIYDDIVVAPVSPLAYKVVPGWFTSNVATNAAMLSDIP